MFLIFPSFLSGKTVRLTTIEGSPVSEICSRILKEVFLKAGLEMEVTAMPNLRAARESSSGNFDGETHRISSYGDSHPELVQVPFSYYSIDTNLFSLAGSCPQGGMDNLKEYRFAILKGVAASRRLTDGFSRVQEFEDSSEMMRFLLLGRTDFVILSRIHGLSVIKEIGAAGIVTCEPPIDKTELFLYLNRSVSGLVPLIEKTMGEMSRSGELAAVIKNAETAVMQ